MTKHVAVAATGPEQIQTKIYCSRHPPWQLHVSAAEEILGSAPQRRHHGTSSSTCRQPHTPAATRSLLHLVAAACLLCPLLFGETGATTAACAGGTARACGG
jgi:hypothetical protein